MSRLVDTFYAARFDETMILMEEVIKEIGVENVIDEMAGRIPIEILGTNICNSVEEKFVEKKHLAEAISISTIAGLQSLPINEDPNSAISTEIPVVENGACKVFVEMSEPILEEDFLGIEGTNVAHYMFDEMPKLSSVDSDEDLYGNKDSISSFPYILDFRSNDDKSNWGFVLLSDMCHMS